MFLLCEEEEEDEAVVDDEGCAKNAPPDPKEEPAVEANALAWEITTGSWVAWVARVAWRSSRKWGFGVKVWGVGGRVVVVPRAREGVGGVVGRRLRRCEEV